MKRLTLVYAAFLASVVAAADAGACRKLFHLVNEVPGADKVLHFVLIGTLALLLNLCLGRRKVGRRGVLLGSVIVLTIATAEECSQLCFTTRTFDLLDLAADCAGIFLASKLCCFQGRHCARNALECREHERPFRLRRSA